MLTLVLLVACRDPVPVAQDTLVAAARDGRVRDLLALIDAGAPPNARDGGVLPLVAAARAGHDTVVAELLAAGADPMLTDSTGANAWVAAVQAGRVSVADRLILHAAREAGAGPAVMRWFAGVRGEIADPPPWLDVLSGDLLPIGLMYAAHHDRADLIVTMRRGREIPNPTGYHALAVAARWGRLAAVRALLDIDVHPDLETSRRSTALMEAARDGHVEVAEALLRAGADPNHRDGNGESALHWARRFNQSAFAATLERRGADPSRVNLRGETPAAIAPGAAPLP
jgi:ankyrin repeat protein